MRSFLIIRALIPLACFADAKDAQLTANHTSDASDSMSDLVSQIVDKLGDRLLGRALQTSVLDDADLDNATMGKPGTSSASSIQLLQQPSSASHLAAQKVATQGLAGAQRATGRAQSSTPSAAAAKHWSLPKLSLSPKDGQKAVGALLTGLLMFAPVMDADAARSGGRMGGSSGFSSRRAAPPPRAAPAPQAAPRTNVYVTPGYGMAPSIGMSPFGGFGGYGYGYGGGMNSGTFLGLTILDEIVREQRRQAYLKQQLQTQQQLGADQVKIAELQAQLKAQDAKVDGLKAQAPQMDQQQMQQLMQKLDQQQKEIDSLKAGKEKAPAR